MHKKLAIVVFLFVLFISASQINANLIAGRGDIEFTSEPAGSNVYLFPYTGSHYAYTPYGEYYVGYTPITLTDWMPKNYTVLFNANEYENYITTISVLPNQKTKVHGVLQKSPTGFLSVTSNPPGASVTSDNSALASVKFQGKKTPVTVELPVGTYTIRLMLNGYGNHIETVTVSQGQTITISPTMVLNQDGCESLGGFWTSYNCDFTRTPIPKPPATPTPASLPNATNTSNTTITPLPIPTPLPNITNATNITVLQNTTSTTQGSSSTINITNQTNVTTSSAFPQSSKLPEKFPDTELNSTAVLSAAIQIGQLKSRFDYLETTASSLSSYYKLERDFDKSKKWHSASQLFSDGSNHLEVFIEDNVNQKVQISHFIENFGLLKNQLEDIIKKVKETI